MKHDDCIYAITCFVPQKDGAEAFEVTHCNKLKAYIINEFCDNCCTGYVQSRVMAKARGEEK